MVTEKGSLADLELDESQADVPTIAEYGDKKGRTFVGARSSPSVRSIRVVATLVALVFSVAGPPASGIVLRHDTDSNQYEADREHFPTLFALYRTEAGHRDCVATLIAKRWAITAAHCTKDDILTSSIADGGYSIEIAGAKLDITRVIRHEASDAAPKRDLALLYLSEPVEHVQPSRLYRQSDELGQTILIAGWGDSGNGLDGVTHADGKFRVAKNLVDTVRDGWLIWRFDDPRSRASVALEHEGVAGPGDSGGPAFIATTEGFAVAGISSGQKTSGRPEGTYGVEEYYVRVSQFVGWIDAAISPTESVRP
ncbi:MAG: trypsin-like serine protease [Woeseiaceae bacterium]|nr:trypsin-like serine protease [Woeseiaceae bacterium]